MSDSLLALACAAAFHVWTVLLVLEVLERVGWPLSLAFPICIGTAYLYGRAGAVWVKSRETR